MKFYSILTCLTLILMCASCGEDTTSSDLPDVPEGFGVEAVYPKLNATHVSLLEPIVLTFNENIDQGTLNTAMLFQQKVGNTTTNATNNLQVTVSGNILTLTPSSTYQPNAGYTLTLLPSLKSVTGRPLQYVSVFTFFTGLDPDDQGGALIDPTSPPHVVSVTNEQDCYSRAFRIRMSEDLVTVPQVDYQIRAFAGIGNGIAYSSGSALVYAVDNMHTFIVDLGINPDFENMNMGFFIKVISSATVDLNGENMLSDYPSNSQSLESGYHHQINQIVTTCPSFQSLYG